MRRYETTFITHPDLPDEDLERVVQKAVGLIEQHQGDVFQVQNWGKKRLAYKIRKQSRGHYTMLDYSAGPAAVREVERLLRLDDNVLRFLTVMVEEAVDAEAVKASLSRAEGSERSSEEEATEEVSQAEGETETESPEEPEVTES